MRYGSDKKPDDKKCSEKLTDLNSAHHHSRATCRLHVVQTNYIKLINFSCSSYINKHLIKVGFHLKVVLMLLNMSFVPI